MSRLVTSIDLWVRDLAASLAFYRLIGFDIPQVDDDAAFAAVHLDNGLSLLWGTDEVIRSYDPHRNPGEGDSRLMLEVSCGSPVEVDRLFEEVVAGGHLGHLPPFDAFWGARFAVVKDPDGNLIGLTAPAETASEEGS